LIPRVYSITDTRISGLSHLEQVKRLIDGGATVIQLREKRASPRDFYEQAVECVRYAHSHDVKIIINDRVDIALMCDADGVHLGQDDMPPAAAREIWKARKIIGYSTHSVEQAIAAADSGVDYIAIGPVFATTTKADPGATVGIDGVAKVRAVIGNIPLVAIGGINRANTPEVMRAGADSVAVVSGLVGEPERIAVNIRELLDVWKR
jgi:thiamine-phosphate pyrophosphorylase